MRKIYETKPKDLQNLQLLEYINRHLLMRLAYLCRFNKSKTQKEDLLGATKQAIGYFLEKDIEIMKNDRGQFALVSGGTKLILTLYKYGDSDHSQVYINHFGPANN